ncbi:hypothetical protein [Hydrogenobaculum acidophilum]
MNFIFEKLLKKRNSNSSLKFNALASNKTETPLIIIFLEVFVFTGLYVFVGFLFNKNDVLFINSKTNPIPLLVLAVTLYYGVQAGLSLIFLVFGLNFFLYESINFRYLLWNTVLMLIANEFRYYWQKKIDIANIELYTTKEALERLRKNFFLLNLSHKELENYYVRRHYSLRDIMSLLRQKAYSDININILFNFLLDILYHHFTLREGCILRIDSNSNIDILASNTNCDDIKTDSLFIKALEDKDSFYMPITKLEDNLDTKILAVVCYETNAWLYTLCIKDIAFTYLQEEIMDYMRILLGYMAEDAEFIETASREKINIVCSMDFTKELFYSKKLYNDYKIESYICVLKSSSDKSLDIQKKIRGSDVFCFKKEDDAYYFYILLYFTTRSGVDKFIERLGINNSDLEINGIYPVYEYAL